MGVLALLGCSEVLGFDDDYGMTAPPQVQPPEGRLGVGNRIPWQNEDWFLLGAAVPWYGWNTDFGGGVTGAGVSDPSVSSALADRFVAPRNAQIRVMRWALFPGEPWQLGAPGTPKLAATVAPDIDAALALAEAQDLYLQLAVLNREATPDSWISDPVERAALSQQVAALIEPYRAQPRIISWELFYEVRPAGVEDAQALASTVAEIIERTPPTQGYFTMQLDDPNYMTSWSNIGLDYLVVSRCTQCGSYTDLVTRGVNIPVVLAGVAPPGTDGAFFLSAYQLGFAGVVVWSVCYDKTGDQIQIDYAAASDFAQSFPAAGP